MPVSLNPVLSDAGAPSGGTVRHFELPDAAATDALGQRFARAFLRGRQHAHQAAVAADAPSTTQAPRALQLNLYGDLGAGKTAFVRAALRALGYAGRVKSPTYTLVEPYRIDDARAADGGFDVFHFDLYRFSEPTEWLDSGFDEYLVRGALCLIEWPDKAGACLKPADLQLTLTLPPDDVSGRRACLQALTPLGQACLDRC
ncbi:MAG: tRNA (adenosine(37)-N6)-threonylcarbamoyltransferase complex ATPase subunit type 1 TsaE [Janthinobacterium lividum]